MVYIKDKDIAKRLISALENANKKPEKEVHFARTVSNATRKEIREMFSYNVK